MDSYKYIYGLWTKFERNIKPERNDGKRIGEESWYWIYYYLFYYSAWYLYPFWYCIKDFQYIDIPIDSIYKDNPYDNIETLPALPSDSEKRNIDSNKNSYISDRTARILKKFDYTELPMVDELIADLYVLDDATRRDLFKYTKMLKKNHTFPERAADLKDIK